ncbi:SIR2 family protein [Chloroflexi bacterium TSY]|nr:SIR2 family protein [Chloroflexi bacterium TSY]
MEVELDFLNDLNPQPEAETTIEAIIRLIDEDKVVPIVSNALVNDLLIGSHSGLIGAWARNISYPLIDEGHTMARMTQFAAISQAGDGSANVTRIKYRYIEFMKQVLQAKANRDEAITQGERDEVEEEAPRLSVSDIANRFNYPSRNSADQNPLLVLTGLPLSIFVTTSFHECLEEALRTHQKVVRTEVFPWQEGLAIPSVFAEEPDYVPSPQEPLVYHLHGLDRHAESLVLTEDDHLDFLTNMFRAGRNVELKVREALTTSSLLLLGYHPQEWDFRTVFRGIIKPRPASILKDNVYIQVEQGDQHQADYLEKYMRDAYFEVEWQQPADFITTLYQGWASR